MSTVELLAKHALIFGNKYVNENDYSTISYSHNSQARVQVLIQQFQVPGSPTSVL